MPDPDTERLHELFNSVDSLDELLEELDSERTAYELREAVTAVGREVEVSDDLQGPFFDETDLGWLLLVIEAHNRDSNEGFLEVDL